MSTPPRRPVKIAVIGGGSSYTPEIIEGLLARREDLPLRELWLVDVPAGRRKLEIVTALARRMAARVGASFPIHATLERREALPDADFVLSQFRVGGAEARIRDERIALRHGAIGQETVGAGGFAKALRTIPATLALCRDIESLCPQAFLINFTNPSGIVTEAVTRQTRVRVVGLCNNPLNMTAYVARAFSVEAARVRIEFVGANHLVWGQRVFVDGADVTRATLEKIADDVSYTNRNIPAHEWPRELLLSLGAMPNPYHKYYYLTDVLLGELLEAFRAGEPTRGETVRALEEELFRKYEDPQLDVKPEELSRRGGALYSEAACRLVTSILNDRHDVQCVDTPNRGALLDLPEQAVVEVNCVITAEGPVPLTVGHLRPQILGLLQLVKAYEALTIEAALHGDRQAALQALTLNPLVPSFGVAERILADILAENREHLPQFD